MYQRGPKTVDVLPPIWEERGQEIDDVLWNVGDEFHNSRAANYVPQHSRAFVASYSVTIGGRHRDD